MAGLEEIVCSLPLIRIMLPEPKVPTDRCQPWIDGCGPACVDGRLRMCEMPAANHRTTPEAHLTGERFSFIYSAIE
jgi:hypothetical protein